MKLKHASFLVVGVALAAGTVFAGSKFTGNGNVVVVQASNGSGSATGYLGHIYNSPTVNEYIGCQKYVDGGLFCHARTENNVHVSCMTNSAYLGKGVSSLSPDARLTFRWNASGRCTAIAVTHSSEFQDKQG